MEKPTGKVIGAQGIKVLPPMMEPLSPKMDPRGQDPAKVVHHSHFPPAPPSYPSTPRKMIAGIQQNTSNYNETVISMGLEALKSFNFRYILSTDFLHFLKEVTIMLKDYLVSVENKELKLIVFLLVVIALVGMKFVQNHVSWKNRPLGQPTASTGSDHIFAQKTKRTLGKY